MDNSVGFTLEKIKLIEQEKENELKEKREFEAAVYNLNKSIRETKAQIDNFDRELKDLVTKTIQLKPKIEIEKIKRTSLQQQGENLKTKLHELQIKSDQGMKEVWQLRASLCSSVQSVSDECDLRALLMKPVMTAELITKTTQMAEELEPKPIYEEKLNNAKKRRDDLKKELARLQNEPECGEEFVRIKNALRYSLRICENHFGTSKEGVFRTHTK